MKKNLLLLVSLTALLAACSSPSAPGSGAGGTPNPAPPAQPSAGYPYNPDANTVQSRDARVPYYGEWVWAVAFQGGTTFGGKMSISLRADEETAFKNMGGGASAWCPDDITSCAYSGDIGLVGTFVDSGKGYLTATHYDAATDKVKWLGIDTDGRVGREVKGAPTLSGTGQWIYADGTKATVAFAMAQVSTTPSVRPSAASLAVERGLGAQLVQLPTSALSAQRLNTMQARALAAASVLADQR